ncbi:MAG: AI-2E family transporter [Cyanobacteria bacterium QS_8_64_29]|nr:MAG: AI-2E family transporter [Cyanobacteria bacterium QS_8_64_29]
MTEQSEQRISLSSRNLLVGAAIAFAVLLLWQLRSLLVVLMIATVLASALAPIVNNAQRLGVPRILSVLLVYLVLLSGLAGAGLLMGPTVIEQIQRLVRQLPAYLEAARALVQDTVVRLGMTEPQALEQLNQFFDVQSLTGWIVGSGQQVLVRSYGFTRGVIGGVLSLVLAVLLSGYMLSGSQRLIRGIVNLFPQPWNQRLAAQVKPVSQRMGGYIQGRVLVSAILGVAVTVGLSALSFSEFALGLGAIAGVTNLIPFFGPLLGSIPALIVATSQGGWAMLWVLLLFAVIQNVETYVLDPLLVGTSVRVHPLYQLLAVLGGAQVLGIIGALIVPPWVAGSAVLLEELYLHPKQEAEGQAAAAPVGAQPEAPGAVSMR